MQLSGRTSTDFLVSAGIRPSNNAAQCGRTATEFLGSAGDRPYNVGHYRAATISTTAI